MFLWRYVNGHLRKFKVIKRELIPLENAYIATMEVVEEDWSAAHSEPFDDYEVGYFKTEVEAIEDGMDQLRKEIGILESRVAFLRKVGQRLRARLAAVKQDAQA